MRCVLGWARHSGGLAPSARVQGRRSGNAAWLPENASARNRALGPVSSAWLSTSQAATAEEEANTVSRRESAARLALPGLTELGGVQIYEAALACALSF
jgi:hypothetical protein